MKYIHNLYKIKLVLQLSKYTSKPGALPYRVTLVLLVGKCVKPKRLLTKVEQVVISGVFTIFSPQHSNPDTNSS